MEFISYHAILSSSELAKERGTYESYNGSKWERGIFPLDTVALLEVERGMKIDVNRDHSMDWSVVKEHVKQYGMRNSNTMAIAPTATISTIAGCFPSIEPIYKNIYVKANMSGEFTVVNPYMILDLKKFSLWNQDMLERLKYYDGSIQLIPEIPEHIREKYKEAFEVDPLMAIRQTSVRAKWIDQSQSHNVFMKGVSGNKLNDIYIAAWQTGLKTTYYLRTLAATQIEKSTLDASKYGFTQKREYGAETTPLISEKPITTHAMQVQKSMQQMQQARVVEATEKSELIKLAEEIKLEEGKSETESSGPKVCLIDDPDCEACQ
jgi:ribonucleoside-diphosphate reductase alpha chain